MWWKNGKLHEKLICSTNHRVVLGQWGRGIKILVFNNKYRVAHMPKRLTKSGLESITFFFWNQVESGTFLSWIPLYSPFVVLWNPGILLLFSEILWQLCQNPCRVTKLPCFWREIKITNLFYITVGRSL